MKAPKRDLVRIIDRKRYDTATATVLAGDDFWDGHNWERSGRNTFLYRTPKGNYFMVELSQWQGEKDKLTPVSLDEAIAAYEGVPGNEWGNLPEHRVEYSEAFPGVAIEEA